MKKEAFLDRVRGALHRKAGTPVETPPALLPPLSDWDTDALAEQFRIENEAVGGQVHVVADLAAARRVIKGLLDTLNVATFICTTDAIVEEVLSAVNVPLDENPSLAGVGISGVHCALATTGTLVLRSEVGRKPTLLPMNHIAILQANQIVPTMAEALERHLGELPSAWVQATGPSRTADIELTLTTGVHGPGVVHTILIMGDA